jgi:hypothetical protein
MCRTGPSVARRKMPATQWWRVKNKILLSKSQYQRFQIPYFFCLLFSILHTNYYPLNTDVIDIILYFIVLHPHVNILQLSQKRCSMPK